MTDGPAGVVLAAGAGTRLRPLTERVPKALCPVDGVPLVDLALDRLSRLLQLPAADDRRGDPDGDPVRWLAVNAHHHADAVAEHVRGRAHVSVEQPVALGTAGALGALRDWVDGRDVVLTNADAYLPGGLGTAARGFLDGWDGERCRLLCRPAAAGERADFHDRGPDGADRALRYVGACLLPGRLVARLQAVPSGLYEVLWREAAARPGGLDLVTLAEIGTGTTGSDVAIDCGTPRDYLLANLHASGGASVIGSPAPGTPPAVVEGTVERCVVWSGARVLPGEHLVECIRAGTAEQPLTVDASASPPLPALQRWEASGAHWTVLRRDARGLEIALVTCTGDEEMGRILSADHDLLAWVGTSNGTL